MLDKRCPVLQPLLSQRESESDRHRTKRANVKAGKLQQKMSALMGRPLGDQELRAIFPSFSAQMPGSAFSGVFPTLASRTPAPPSTVSSIVYGGF